MDVLSSVVTIQQLNWYDISAKQKVGCAILHGNYSTSWTFYPLWWLFNKLDVQSSVVTSQQLNFYDISAKQQTTNERINTKILWRNQIWYTLVNGNFRNSIIVLHSCFCYEICIHRSMSSLTNWCLEHKQERGFTYR